MKRFIDLADLEPAAVRDLIALAQKLEKSPSRRHWPARCWACCS